MTTAANADIVIGDRTVKAGQRCVIDLPIPKFYTHMESSLPIQVVSGKKSGPVLFVSAAIHGDELNGVEVIRQLLRHSALRTLRGTLLAIPIVNVFGIIQQSRYLPDRRDLNRSFPGSESGPLAARLAHIFLNEIIRKCTHGIDIHTGANHRANLPQIRANLNDPQTEALARAFQVPVVINSNLRDGSLREAAATLGIPILLYEAGEALRFDNVAIRAGVKGVLSVMRALNMLPAHKRSSPLQEPYIARSSVWERAPHSGILRSSARLGQRVKKNELLGIVSDPSDMIEEQEYQVYASREGIIIGKSNLPLVNEGDALYHIASFEDSRGVAAEVQSFQLDNNAPLLTDPPEIGM